MQAHHPPDSSLPDPPGCVNLAGIADENLIAMVHDRHDTAPQAFAELVRRHEPTLVRLFQRFHPRLDDVTDLAQELWVRLWRSLTHHVPDMRFDPARGPFRLYLLHMARNVAIDWYRRSVRDSSRRGQLPPSEVQDEPSDPPASDAFEDVIFSDLLGAIERRLDDRERVVFTLLWRDVPIAKICELTDLSQPSVWRIQQKLKQTIDDVIGS
jgi:RNA polymerase sigma factor (sigma-70 family)